MSVRPSGRRSSPAKPGALSPWSPAWLAAWLVYGPSSSLCVCAVVALGVVVDEADGLIEADGGRVVAVGQHDGALGPQRAQAAQPLHQHGASDAALPPVG